MTYRELFKYSPDRFRAFLEYQYYTTCVEHRTLISDEDLKRKLDVLILNIITIENACVKAQEFELAAVCRDTNIELVVIGDLVIDAREPNGSL